MNLCRLYLTDAGPAENTLANRKETRATDYYLTGA